MLTVVLIPAIQIQAGDCVYNIWDWIVLSVLQLWNRYLGYKMKKHMFQLRKTPNTYHLAVLINLLSKICTL